MPHADPPFHWALIGPGNIARRFAEATQRLPGSRLQAVWGRDADRTREFARRWSRPEGPPTQACTDLAALLVDPQVHGVYIATPHARHLEFALAALQAGKPVLCEKPLVPTLAQGRRLVAAAREHGVFLMEALWTRFLPLYQDLAPWLHEQRIGPLRAIQSSFCFPAPYDAGSRLFNPTLAGGALLDVGIYNLTATRWALQQALGEVPPLRGLQVQARLAPTGVDQRLAATLDFGDGRVSQFVCGFDGYAPNRLDLLGESGVISVPEPFWGATQAELRRRHQTPDQVERLECPHPVNGFEGQIEEAQRCIRAGLVESPRLPHAETLAVLDWMDRIRAEAGVRFPFE